MVMCRPLFFIKISLIDSICSWEILICTRLISLPFFWTWFNFDLKSLILVPCWNGYQLFVHLCRLLHPFRLPLAFQSDPFDFSQKEKALSQNPLGKSQKKLAEMLKEEKKEEKKKDKKEAKKTQEAGEQSSKDLIVWSAKDLGTQ